MNTIEQLVQYLTAIANNATDIDTRMTAQDALALYQRAQDDRDTVQEREANGSWERESSDLAKWSAVLKSSDDFDAARERVQDDMGEPLDVSTERCVQVLLTTGGPARGYTLFIDSGGEPTSGYYWYQDWYTAKRVFWLDTEELARVVTVYDIYTGD